MSEQAGNGWILKSDFEMKKFNRELLVLLAENVSQQKIDEEIESLHDLLYDVEKTEKLIEVHEIIDINKRRITTSPKVFKNILRYNDLNPFVFLYNLN